MKPILFVDVETTGLDPVKFEILDIAFVAPNEEAFRLLPESVQGRMAPLGLDLWGWSSLVKPLRPEIHEPEALAVNGYTAEGWSAARPWEQVKPEAEAFLKVALLAGQHIAFDAGFLRSHGLKPMRQMVELYSFSYARLRHQLPSLSLRPVAAHLNVNPDGIGGAPHTALRDAIDAALVYRALT